MPDNLSGLANVETKPEKLSAAALLRLISGQGKRKNTPKICYILQNE